MSDRVYNQTVTYPFFQVPVGQEAHTAGIKDVLLYTHPDNVPYVGPILPAASMGCIGAWFRRRQNDFAGNMILYFVTRVVQDPDHITVGLPPDELTYAHSEQTFSIPLSGVGIQVIRGTTDPRSVLIVNMSEFTSSVGVITDVLVEPSRVIPDVRQITEVRLYNEYRQHNPAERSNLPADSEASVIPQGSALTFNDGYNCAFTYDDSTGTLQISGVPGRGLGRATAVPWDDTAEDFKSGIRSINGLNQQGVVELETGRGVYLDASVPGVARLITRDQGDVVNACTH